MMKKRCAGFTLVEVIVVIGILGLLMGMSGLAFGSLRAPSESEVAREFRRARSEAIRTGRPATTVVNRTLRNRPVLFLPDGRAVGPGADPLTGAPLNAR
jgi:prepilin-type N-terminal cleavage/methylation domain-containing protein